MTELIIDAACALVGATVVHVLLAGALELSGFLRDLRDKAVRW